LLEENVLDTKPRLAQTLPVDAPRATLVGRAWLPGAQGGPTPVLVRDGELIDLSPVAATMSELLDRADVVARGPIGAAPSIGSLEAALSNTPAPGGCHSFRALRPAADQSASSPRACSSA
jgi:fumarylacetoacetate (FAA) hydrolase family protein